MPWQAKAWLRQRPGRKLLVVMLAAVGRHMARASPSAVRKPISRAGVRQKPRPSVTRL